MARSAFIARPPHGFATAVHAGRHLRRNNHQPAHRGTRQPSRVLSRMSDAPAIDYARRHLRFGWWSLLVFSGLGLLLELLHGFKFRMYLDVSNDTRRLMWTLAHAHGTLLALVHIAFALNVAAFPDVGVRRLRLISRTLIASSILLPAGFFLGGVAFYSGDPG